MNYDLPGLCDICGKELDLDSRGNRLRHPGACARERNRRQTARRRTETKRLLRTVVEFSVELNGKVFDRLSCGHLVELGGTRYPRRTCRKCRAEAEVAA